VLSRVGLKSSSGDMAGRASASCAHAVARRNVYTCTANCRATDSTKFSVNSVDCGRCAESFSSGSVRDMKRKQKAISSPVAVACVSPSLTPSKNMTDSENAVSRQFTARMVNTQ